MHRSIPIVLALVALVALAGCGGGGDATPTATDGNGGTPTATDGMGGPTATDTGGMGGPTPTASDATPTDTDGTTGPTPTTTSAPASWDLFQFDHPARYEYEVRQPGQNTSTIVLDVTEVGDEQVTVRTEFRSDGVTFGQNISGTPQQVRSQLAQSPTGALLIAGLFNPALVGVQEDGRFRVGASWQYTSEGQTLRYEVTERGSYAGIECYRMEVSENDTTQGEFCVSPEHGLSLYVGIYDGETLQFEMELVDYEEG